MTQSTTTGPRPLLGLVKGTSQAELTEDEKNEQFLRDAIESYVTDWIDRVRDFALECEPENLAKARQKYNPGLTRRLPEGLARAFRKLDDVTQHAYTILSSSGANYLEGRTRDAGFFDNVEADVVRFLPEFKEAIVDFVVFSELFLEEGQGQGIAQDGEKFVAFKDLGCDLQSEIVQELYSQGLELMAVLRKAGATSDAKLIGRNSPIIYWQCDEIEELLGFVDDEGEPLLTKSQITSMVLADPRGGCDVAAAALLKASKAKDEAEIDPSSHPSYIEESPGLNM